MQQTDSFKRFDMRKPLIRQIRQVFKNGDALILYPDALYRAGTDRF